jgi:ankyrin repeat protein
VRLLLSRGARVDVAVAHGTPLHIAASYGKSSVLKILLDHHADVMCNFYALSTDTSDTPTWLLWSSLIFLTIFYGDKFNISFTYSHF